MALRPIFAQAPSAVWWQRILAIAYPLFDVTLLVAMTIVFVRRSAHRFDRRLLLFGIGIVIQTSADLSFLVRSAVDGPGAIPNHGQFLLAATFLLVSALNLRIRAVPREYAEVRTQWGSSHPSRG
jgi:hypothetical protein